MMWAFGLVTSTMIRSSLTVTIRDVGEPATLDWLRALRVGLVVQIDGVFVTVLISEQVEYPPAERGRFRSDQPLQPFSDFRRSTCPAAGPTTSQDRRSIPVDRIQMNRGVMPVTVAPGPGSLEGFDPLGRLPDLDLNPRAIMLPTPCAFSSLMILGNEQETGFVSARTRYMGMIFRWWSMLCREPSVGSG